MALPNILTLREMPVPRVRHLGVVTQRDQLARQTAGLDELTASTPRVLLTQLHGLANTLNYGSTNV